MGDSYVIIVDRLLGVRGAEIEWKGKWYVILSVRQNYDQSWSHEVKECPDK
jgi:hypothetical protein